eukprot:gnl/MRDRNA2_/MRDRNA2_18546_c0_seq1.p1 gnl/MRDRNA2_/MRDRNA2_18546_c0~~gnl/MRDRNA2_/MRDRNA2_18546_c0_seq1.p1  ORF type:complete len:411 (+),score=80.45 gnl/MRDRNA2_/MRDRNA2_18546_c0_seq1:125-1357(+)
MGGKKPKVPGRRPDPQFSQAAWVKLREEIDELKSLPSASTAPNAEKRGPLRRRQDSEDGQKGIFNEYVRDFTQSQYDEARRRRGPADYDLGHNQKNLTCNSRFQKLDDEILFRANPVEWVEERADLVQRHGTWFRVKTAQDKARQRQQEKEKGLQVMPRKKGKVKENPLIFQLREMQNQLERGGEKKMLPKPLKLSNNQVKRRASYEEESDDLDQESPRQKAIFSFLEWALWQFGSIQEAFKAIDVNSNSSVHRDEFLEACKKKHFQGDAHEVYDALDAERKGEISLREFAVFKPYLEEFLDDLETRHLTDDTWQPTVEDLTTPTETSPTARARASMGSNLLSAKGPGSGLIERYHLLHKERKILTLRQKEDQKEQKTQNKGLPAVDMPKTFSLMVYRNADKHHPGRLLF